MFGQELSVAVEAARAAGEEILRLQTSDLRVGRKHGYEVVSEADVRAAEMLHDTLTGAFPDTGWLSEEHVDNDVRLGRGRAWIVDPLDGTREYVEGVPEYAVSIGLVVDGAPVLGVVFNPARNAMHAATCSGVTERAAGDLPDEFEVLVGRGEYRLAELPPLPAGARPRGVGSVAYRLALLAAGQGDAVLTGYGRHEWDVAAGAALCLAAGMRVTDILGAPLLFNKANPEVRGLLVARAPLHGHLAAHFQRLVRR